ncbi:MAG: DUF3108 domain-containing protein [Candidatus Lindowbacteria bacterium]|nr:DUF3108 domain-containing protein [Candidatus Lindowbacteria bacterium]
MNSRIYKLAALCFPLAVVLSFAPSVLSEDKVKEIEAVTLETTPVVDNKSWQVGERLTYDMNYLGSKVGVSSLAVKDAGLIKGRPAIEIQSAMQGKWFFFKINSQTTSLTDQASLFSWKYSKSEHYGKKKPKSEFTVFDHEKGEFQRTSNEKTHNVEKFKPYIPDVMGVIYWVRTQDLKPNTTITLDVVDGRRDYTMKIKIHEPESVTSAVGTYECLKVEPVLYYRDGREKKKGKMVLWMTNDSRHIPIKMKTSLPFGSIIGTLKTATGTRPVVEKG